jgi:hypothetical protein
MCIIKWILFSYKKKRILLSLIRELYDSNSEAQISYDRKDICKTVSALMLKLICD